MKPVCGSHRLVFVFVVLIYAFCVGGCSGDRPKDRVGGTSSTTKDIRFPKYDKSMFEEIVDTGNDCVGVYITPFNTIFVPDIIGVEDVDKFFDGYCQNQTQFRSCLTENTNHFEVSKNETFVKTFKIYRNILEKLLDVGCANGGQRLVTFWQGLENVTRDNRDFPGNNLQMCFKRSKILLSDVKSSTVDISSKLFIIYTQMQNYNECIQQIQLDPTLQGVVEFFMDEIMNVVECIDPLDGTIVPCGTVDIGLVSAQTVCDLKTRKHELPIYDALEYEAGRCFDYALDREYRFGDLVQDRAAIRNDVYGAQCIMKVFPLECVVNLKLFTSPCLNETQTQEFNNLVDFIKNALWSAACFEEAKRLGDVMLEVYRLKRSGQGHAIWDCVDVAKSTRKQIDAHRTSSKNMRFYHELEAFKGCFVSKLVGDQTSVDAATSLIGELLGMVKCVHPEEGTTVLCETLVSSSLNI